MSRTELKIMLCNSDKASRCGRCDIGTAQTLSRCVCVCLRNHILWSNDVLISKNGIKISFFINVKMQKVSMSCSHVCLLLLMRVWFLSYD